ncbi:hypothetical protein [Leucobacter luti]|uniref:hypothetical protein n=1 Tax=Leucobacter luti TaxID=340320 RepID=UPI00140485B1|nr:hypothetical protein [Leucobacter luti]MCW2289010.1 hypothetical protein [Leucobacter luti]
MMRSLVGTQGDPAEANLTDPLEGNPEDKSEANLTDPLELGVVVTAVTFDGIGGSNLRNNRDGTWSVVTPAHDVGTVDVVLAWTYDGIAQNPITYVGGFTYTKNLSAPVFLTNPANQRVEIGETATFTVTTEAHPDPIVNWEVSHDAGATWTPIPEKADEPGLAEAQSFSVVGSATNSGYQYRATAYNESGRVTSLAASLSVNDPTTEVVETKPVTGVTETVPQNSSTGNSNNTAKANSEKKSNVAPELAATGATDFAGPFLGAVLAALIGLGIVVARLVTRHRAVR